MNVFTMNVDVCALNCKTLILEGLEVLTLLERMSTIKNNTNNRCDNQQEKQVFVVFVPPGSLPSSRHAPLSLVYTKVRSLFIQGGGCKQCC